MAATGGQAYRWSRIGGHLALDLCNTVSWRLDPARRVERLTDPAALVDWFCALSAPAARDRLRADLGARPRDATRALHAVRALRDATTRLIDAHLAGEPGSSGDVATVTRRWRAALAVADVAPGLPLRPAIAPSTVPLVTARLALSVTDLLGSTRSGALRRCDGAGCGWLFLDTTRNHSRRWCDPFDCGNRARVRSYARRRRDAAPQATGPTRPTVAGSRSATPTGIDDARPGGDHVL